MTPSIKETLIALEREDLYVFHGSGKMLHELEPRQAYTFIDGVNTPDGPPAVWASDFVEFAIFMAIVTRTNCPKSVRSSCIYEGNGHIFGASQDTLDQLSEASKGYVHVLDRALFERRGVSEWFCVSPVQPRMIIEVRFADLPEKIEIIPSPQIV